MGISCRRRRPRPSAGEGVRLGTDPVTAARCFLLMRIIEHGLTMLTSVWWAESVYLVSGFRRLETGLP